MVTAYKGYTPGSRAALLAAAAYVPPAGIIAEPGYPDPYSRSGLVSYHSGQETEDTPLPIPVVPYPRVVTTSPVVTPVAFNGVAETLPGMETDDVVPNGIGQLPVEAAPMGFPLAVAGAIVTLSLGFLKRFAARFGMKALKVLIGAAAFKEFLDLIGIGAPDETEIRIRKGAKRRYSIGNNPRVRTLQKVARHVQRMLKRHDKVLREFFPKKTARYGIPPAKALSAIEKAAIRGA